MSDCGCNDMSVSKALTKFLKKHGKTIEDFSDKAADAGKTAIGAGSLGAKKTASFARENPKTAAGLTAAGVGGAYAASDDEEKPKKKRPYED